MGVHQATEVQSDRSSPWVSPSATRCPDIPLVLLSQTFIDMEGSGFGGDLESLRVSGAECLSCVLGEGETLSHAPPLVSSRVHEGHLVPQGHLACPVCQGSQDGLG